MAGKKIADGWQKLLSTPTVQSCCRRHPRLWHFLCQRFSTAHAGGIFLTIGLSISISFAVLFAEPTRSAHL
jgi:hypothetical protein